VTPHLVKLADPGCQAAIKVHNAYPDSKVTADATNPPAEIADITAEITGFTNAANKAKNATAKSTMQAEVADLMAIAGSGPAGPSAAVATKATSDEKAITKACGGF
jgi:hypothetical protein